MRFAWGTPWNHRSAIASYSRAIVAELVEQGHAVEIFRTESEEGLGLPPLEQNRGAREGRAIANVDTHELGLHFDALIVNFGDNWAFHAGALAIVGKVPMIAIVHDAVLSGLMHGLRRHTLPLAASRSRGLEDGDDPLPEWIAANAIATIAHGRHYAHRLAAQCRGPCHVLPLAFPALRAVPARRRRDSERLVVATVGHANENKRAEAVIDAIGVSPTLRGRCEYRLLGAVEEPIRQRLSRRAAGWGLPAMPLFSGWLAEDDLAAAFAEIDVVSALRDPVLEGGSASLITALLSARPTLVSNHGPYADIPDDLVLKCTPGREAVDVARHLEWILANSGAAEEMGARAQKFAREHHSSTRYVEGLLRTVGESVSRGPVIMTQINLDRTLDEVGMRPRDPARMRMRSQLAEMIDDRTQGAGSAT
jgi:glycosyltransferase involved in cell wall biosynthesis